MPTLRFSAAAEEQLQRAYALSAKPENESMYRRLVSTLASLENDSALFTLLEATPLPIPVGAIYATRADLQGTWRHLTVAYELSPSTEEVTILSLTWS